LVYGLFALYPTFFGLYISFTNWDGISNSYEFVGFSNYSRLITNDTVFATSVGNNLKFMIFVVVFQTLFSLIFAMYLVKNTKTNVFLRSLYFFPTILATVSVAFIWASMYDSNFGLIQALLKMVGFKSSPGFIADPNMAIYSIAFVQVWMHTGQLMIIFIAGLQSIPR